MTASINCSNMKCPDKHCFYIVASGVTAQRFVVEDFTLDASSPKRVIRKGTIVENVHVEIDENFAVVRIVSEDEEERNGKSRVWLCRRAELRRVKCRLAGALEAAPPHARLAVVENKFATDQLLKLNIGEMVNYYLQESSGEPELSLLNYKGPVPEIGPGIYFGLELLV
ncbi:hypothetical protein PR048_033641 [Dryococelus australis]|uniref:Uncharacterized protein n=1 Tax=Dryococelus australis TaxID=614101 RepID=A0ABQ9G227_9NEOP|nr:hypothetical protein PR048_033641 [Dryococelus australis]